MHKANVSRMVGDVGGGNITLLSRSAAAAAARPAAGNGQ